MAQTASTKASEEVREIMVEVARTQLAAVTAALKFWEAGWNPPTGTPKKSVPN